MRALYLIFGILGIVASFVMFFIVAANKDLDGGTKIAFVFVDLIDFVSSAVFISVYFLMEKSDEFETRIKRIEKYLLHTDEYEQHLKQLTKDENVESPTETIDEHIFEITNKEDMSNKEYGIKLLKEKNYLKAILFLKKAVDEGDISACVHLGNCYMMGLGISKDKEEAVKLFERAHNAGIVNGTFFLGLAYLNGDGVKKNKEEGRELILKASEQGSKKAKEYLEKYRI